MIEVIATQDYTCTMYGCLIPAGSVYYFNQITGWDRICKECWESIKRTVL